jgi:hypothetical protein
MAQVILAQPAQRRGEQQVEEHLADQRPGHQQQRQVPLPQHNGNASEGKRLPIAWSRRHCAGDETARGKLIMTARELHPLARLTLVAVLICGSLTGTAGAQQPSQAQADAIRQSCRGDYQAHCAGVPTGGAAALQCLQHNLGSLSAPCRTAVSATEGGGSTNPPAAAAQGGPAPPPGAMPSMPPREVAAMMRRSCGGDFRALCRGVRPGGGRALACLADHQESLSPPCREAMAAARSR